MKTNWPTKKLGEVCDILDNLRKPITKRDRESGPYPYYGATGIQDHVVGYIFDEELILVGEDGARWDAGDNSAYKISGKSWVNNHAHVLRPHRDIIHEDWLTYFLNISDLSDYITGTTVKKLNQAKLRSIEIPLPPLVEQKKIVAKLEKLLAKVNEAKKLRAEAQESASQLLPAELHKIFEEGKKKGWEEKKIGEITTINPKKSEVSKKQDDMLVSFVPMKAVNEYSQSITDIQERKLGDVRRGYTYFCNNDVLFAKITPCMENGKIAIAKDLKNGIGFGTTEFHVIRASDGIMPEWIYSIIRQPSFRDKARVKMTGSAGQKRVPTDYLSNYKILIPPLPEQKKIVERLDSIFEKVKQLQEYQKITSNDLLSLEQSILSKAFSSNFV